MFFHKYPYTDLSEINLDFLLKKVAELEKRTQPECGTGLPYINVTDEGCVMNDSSAAVENTRIINALLAQRKLLFIPEGDLFTSGPIIVRNKSGIMGLGIQSRIIATGDFNAIEVPVSVSDSEGVYSTVTIKNLSVMGTYSTLRGNQHAGLLFYNYTYNDVMNRNDSAYIAAYKYALEFRASDVSNLYVSSFKYGIKTDNFTALISVRDSMIVHNETAGIFASSSDSIFDNLYVTYNRDGIVTDSESNMFSNVKSYMNGFVENGTQADIDASAGFKMYGQYCRNNMLANVQIQENFGNGIVISDGAHCITLSGVIVDGNGFKSDNSNTGLTLYNSVFDISGHIIATDKNETKSQRFGVYITDNCHDINLSYTEHDNTMSVSEAGWKTFNSVRGPKLATSGTVAVNTTAFSLSGNALSFYDGSHLDVNLRVTATSAASTDTMIADLSDIWQKLPAIGSRPPYVEFMIPDVATGSSKMVYVSDGMLYLGSDVNAGALLNIDISFRPVYYTA